ncbi:MAG: lectin like domain-containing protein, partial [Candidatus Bipolaricaulota bacterium]
MLLLTALGVAAHAAPPTRAPLNPEFVEAQAHLDPMGLSEITEEGYVLGLLPSPLDLSHMTGRPIGVLSPNGMRGFPSTYDLRTLGRLTAVRDQGSCGACWSFAAMASLESWLLTDGAGTWNLSESNLKECHGFDWTPCEGGNSTIAMAYFARQDGPVSEADDPYRDYAVGCSPGHPLQKAVGETLLIPDRSGPLDNDAIKQAVTTYGAVATEIYWSSTAYSSTNRAYYYSGSAVPNHGVAIVGWNDAYSRTLFRTSPPGDGAWIVRNSWGIGWGDGGYFYASYYDTKIGTGNAVFVNAEDPVAGTLYEYDPLGWVTNWGYSTNTAWGANIFTAAENGTLVAVGTYASTVDTEYVVQIRSSLNGTILASQTGTWTLAGYHTVDLDTPVPVTAGQTFVAVVRYTTPGYSYPVPAECYEAGYSSAAFASPGQSYISSNGSTWSDIVNATWGDPTCNVCIKAFATDSGSSDDPVAYWQFDELSGTTAIDSTGTHHGTIVGATRVAGSPDGSTALSFSGVGQCVQVPTSADLG